MGGRIAGTARTQEDDALTRCDKLRIAARVLIKRGAAGNGRRYGFQSRLAEHFGVTRQRVSQIVHEELEQEGGPPPEAAAGTAEADDQPP